jgi:hypothetical protein
MESLDLLCIADRENMRVVCPRAGLVPYASVQPVSIQAPDLGRVFGVAAAGAYLSRHVKFEIASTPPPVLHTPRMLTNTYFV